MMSGCFDQSLCAQILSCSNIPTFHLQVKSDACSVSRVTVFLPLLLLCPVFTHQYFENIQSVRRGLQEVPIIIQGPPSAVIRGALDDEESDAIVQISHDHIHLSGFSVNGIG